MSGALDKVDSGKIVEAANHLNSSTTSIPVQTTQSGPDAADLTLDVLDLVVVKVYKDAAATTFTVRLRRPTRRAGHLRKPCSEAHDGFPTERMHSWNCRAETSE